MSRRLSWSQHKQKQVKANARTQNEQQTGRETNTKHTNRNTHPIKSHIKQTNSKKRTNGEILVVSPSADGQDSIIPRTGTTIHQGFHEVSKSGTSKGSTIIQQPLDQGLGTGKGLSTWRKFILTMPSTWLTCGSHMQSLSPVERVDSRVSRLHS